MGKKTIITLVVLVVVIIISIGVFASIYNTARSQYNEGHQHSKEIALEKGKLATIETIHTFNGHIKYHIISGENVNREPVFVWIPILSNVQKEEDRNEEELVVKKQSSGITKEEAIQVVKSEYNVKKLINVQIGMDADIPIWEVKYKDQANRYTFDFVRFSNGEIIKHMAVKNNKF